MDDFLVRMSHHDEAERRRYQRIPGRGHHAVLLAPGRDRADATISDISRGGAALKASLAAEPGSDVEVELPGANAPVAARIVRSANSVVAIAFHQDQASLALLDRDLAVIGREQAA